MDKIKFSNRTRSHKSYIPKLDKKYIENMCDYLGYTGYIPEVLLHDLINVYTYLGIEGSIENAFIDDSKDKELKEFLRTLSYEYFIGNTPVELAIDTLKQLTLEYNLRQLDDGIIENIRCKSENNLLDMDDRDKILSVSEDLIIDYNNILKLSVKLAKSLKLKVIGSGSVKSKMSGYSDVIKIRKSKLMRPDFNLKLATKSFNVKSSLEEDNEDVIIFIEDCSESMGKGNGYNLVKALQREMVNDVRKIHYYRHFGYSIEYKELYSREDKLIAFSSKVSHHNYVLDYNLVFKEIVKYSKGDIIIVTDGKDFLPNYKGNLNLNFVCLKGNRRVNNICKSSGGKMIIV